MSVALSVCIIACNEERDLPRCLDSVSFADECIVVVDDRSADDTEKLAREAGARVLVHPYEGNVEQKNYALDQARGEWVLALDADEALSPELASELQRALPRAAADLAGFEINRVTWHLGRWIRHGAFYPDWQLRVFRRSAGRWQGVNPHGRVRLAGRVERLEGDAYHWSYRDLADQVERIQDFSRQQALHFHAEAQRARLRDLVLRPPLRFVRDYLLKQGFRDGVPGLVIASATAFHVFLKYAKLWEAEHVRPEADTAEGAGKARRVPAPGDPAP